MSDLVVGDGYKTLQDEGELEAFAALVRQEGISSYLEIGSKFGGSLWRVAQEMLPESRIVTVDLPGGTKAWKESEASLKRCSEELRKAGHRVYNLWGNSQDKKIIEKVRSLGPYDLILIDGDHRMPGVTADWKNYSGMGKRIAFHDISWRRAPTWEGTRIDVPEFWRSVKEGHKYEEIVMCPTGKNNGIGVLWR